MIEAVRRGDTVVTSGGIIGKVTKADESELHVEVADGVRVKVLRSSISEVRGKSDAASSQKSESPKSESKSAE